LREPVEVKAQIGSACLRDTGDEWPETQSMRQAFVLVGIAAFMLIGGLIYLASREGGLGTS